MTGMSLPHDLGNGLVLRQATIDDHDALVEFNSIVHSDDDEPSAFTGASTSDLLGKHRPHPGSSPGEFTLVEDSATGAIVSSLCLIPQTWRYGEINYPATLVELVGTRPEYRNRGLVRRQFEVVHGWCEERGIVVQGIAGIPWYYRQFGYEYALPLSAGRIARRSQSPKLEGEEPVRLREAVAADAPFIARLDATNHRRWLVTAVRDERVWQYEIAGRDPVSDSASHIFVIEQGDGTPIGYVAYTLLPDDPPWIVSFELVETASWLNVVPTVLRHLLAVVDARSDDRPEHYASLELGADHPSYIAMPNVLTPTATQYAMYIRVPDLVGFLLRIAPVLEQRLAGSVAHGFGGELPINLYRTGLKLTFDGGILSSVTQERMEYTVAASFPDLTFLQLLFGFRSMAELNLWYPDCRIRTNEARVLLDVLFPKQPSFVWPVW
ncbi:MAG TPA: GNAT family N-acetyltransferase [Thermomicrobiales bacterium]|nr:GNAT family N-acetyltransferase [Thermomicrobiales bacterium]